MFCLRKLKNDFEICTLIWRPVVHAIADVDDYDPTIVTKKPGDETSDEEKEWLTALEKGELNDYGELSKQKDPMLMTARQVRIY